MQLDPEVCERARQARDARFDGRFFIGVLSTGIYCRPICPVQPPRADRVRFFPSAAAAAAAGLRPCLRCRPEAAPGTPRWQGTSTTVARALALIDAGALDEAGVEALAERVGVGARHLERLFARHLGAGPLAVARTRRLFFAKRLIDDTRLKMADVALASGFSSVRRFNACIQATYRRPPSALRRLAQRGQRATTGTVSLSLPFRPPLAYSAMLGFVAARAITGLEEVRDGCYRRAVGEHATVCVRLERAALRIEIEGAAPKDLIGVVSRVRRMFDLGADPKVIDRHLGRSPELAPRVRALPGLRPVGGWDPFEIAVRAVIGQAVSLRSAMAITERLVERFGQRIAHPPFSRLFPTPEVLAEAGLDGVGLPRARAAALSALAREVASGRIDLGELDGMRQRLLALRGIGPWTAEYVALRLGDPDAFPTGDAALARALGGASPAGKIESWRPWRAYAAMHLWLTPRS